MNSRKAFEAAWIARQRAAGYGTMLADSEFCQRKPDGTYVSLSLDPAWWAWQAAIQHARDVAVQKCEEHAFCEIDGHTERACHACADAIKEALK